MTITAAATVTAAAFTVDRAPLAAALKSLCKVVEKRNTVPICTAVMLTVDAAGSVVLRGLDLDIELAISLACEDAAPGAALIDCHALSASVAKMRGTRVRFADVGGALAMTDATTGTTTRLAMIADRDAATDWPTVQGAEREGMTFDAGQLRDDLARAAVAVSTEETRYYLNGVYFHASTDGGAPVLRMATTDGHRLVRITRPVPLDAGDNLAAGVILPRKAVALIGTLIGSKGKGEAALAFTASRFTFAYGGATMTGKLIDGSFPDYSRVIPSNNPRGFDIAADTLADAIGAVTGHCGKGKDRRPTVAFGLNASGWMTATANDPDNGRAGAMLAPTAVVSPDSDDFGTGINASYAHAIAAKVFGDAARLAVRFADASCPILIESPDVPHVIAVQMPIRIDGGWLAPADVAALNGGAIAAPVAAAAPVTPEHDDEPTPAPITAPAPAIAPEPAPAAVSEPIAANDDAADTAPPVVADDTPASEPAPAPFVIDIDARMAAADSDAIAALEAAGCPATGEAACHAVWLTYVACIVGASGPDGWHIETGRRQHDRKARNRGKVLIRHDTYVYLRDRFNALPPLAPIVASATVAEFEAACPVVSPCPEPVEVAAAVMPSPCPRDDSAAGIAARLAAVEVALGITPAARPARTAAHLRAIRAYLKARADRAAAAAERKRLHDAAVSLAQLLQDEQQALSAAQQQTIAVRAELQASCREAMRLETVVNTLRDDVVAAEVATQQANRLVASLTSELTEERAALARLAPVVAAMNALHAPALAAAA